MSEIVVGSVVQLLASVALWAFLPRGVVLTRRVRSHDWRGEPIGDTWEVRNDSPLPVRIMSVEVDGLLLGEASLSFDDETLENARQDRGSDWKGLVVPPGDTLQAKAFNSRLRIRYRRDGYLGIFERRQLVIQGRI